MIDRMLQMLDVDEAHVDREMRAIRPRVLVDIDVYAPGGFRAVIIRGLATVTPLGH